MDPYDGWSEHNKALKNPEYQMEGMLDCLREEMMMNMPLSTNEEPVVNKIEKHYHFRMVAPRKSPKEYNPF